MALKTPRLGCHSMTPALMPVPCPHELDFPGADPEKKRRPSRGSPSSYGQLPSWIPRFMAAGGVSLKRLSMLDITSRSMSSIRTFSKSTSSRPRSFVKTFSKRESCSSQPRHLTASTCSMRRHSHTKERRLMNFSGTSPVWRHTSELGVLVLRREWPSTSAPSTYASEQPQSVMTYAYRPRAPGATSSRRLCGRWQTLASIGRLQHGQYPRQHSCCPSGDRPAGWWYFTRLPCRWDVTCSQGL
mmetsp:Transcript_6477/g.18126  ORF Transcript_6477/g.18126 Transcript_6477/m.18126 type:complete len:243 (-) Transcript_6477:255-983(-)